MELICIGCEEEFSSEYTWTKFCSSDCIKNYDWGTGPTYYKRHKANEYTQVMEWGEIEDDTVSKPNNEDCIAPLVVRGAQMSFGDYSGKSYKRWDLRFANMAGSDFSHCSFRKADLRCANMDGTNLRGVDLDFANLQAASLVDADLSGASLFRANLIHADLTGANLEDVKRMDKAIILLLGG